MPFQPVPNTIQCDVIFSLFGQNVENVFHVNVLGGVDAVALVDTANEIGAWVISSYLPRLSREVQFLRVEAKNLSIESGGVATFTPPTTQIGGADVVSEAGNVSFCVSMRTASTGRSFRGRKYVMGIPQGQRTGNTLSPTYVGQLLTAFNELIAILDAVSKVLVVVSRIQHGIELVVATTTRVETFSATDNFIDSQRRRLTGRGT